VNTEINEADVEAGVRAAFAGVERPGSLSDRPNPDVDKMARELREPDWTRLTIPQLMRHRAALILLSADAFRFYLPAYLVAGLGDEVDLRDAALYALSPYLASTGPSPADEAAFRGRIAALDDAQRDAVRSWIRWARTRYVSQKSFPALDRAGVWA
jgi:hypothetical protein